MKKLIYIVLSGFLAFQCVGCAGNTDTKKEEIVQEEETYASLLEHGNNLFKQKKYEKALIQYQKAYDKNTSDSQVFAALFKTYTMLKQSDEAEKVIKDAEMNLSQEEYDAFLSRIGKAPQTEEESSLQFGMYVEKITTYVGETIDYNNYFSGPMDQECTLEFNDQLVNINKEGNYILTVTLKPKKGKSISKDVTISVIQKAMEYTPGMYWSNYRMNVRSQASTSADIVGSFAESIEVVVDKIVQSEDGSYWALISTGYVCIKDASTEYMSFLRPRVPVSADYNNDNNAFIDTVCPAVNGLGGYRSPDTFVGSINITISCDNVYLVY